MTLTNLFSDIANAIRAKTGGTGPIVASDFPAAIAGIEGGASLVIATVPDETVAEWGITNLTVPELIGAKYFIIQGNPFDSAQVVGSDAFWEAGKVTQLLYLDGTVIVTALYTPGTQSGKLYVSTEIISDTDFTFDATTGTFSNDQVMFSRIYGDTSTTGNAYTVYVIG